MSKINIQKINNNYPYDLLLLADETIEGINKYLFNSDVYVAKLFNCDSPIGVLCLLSHNEETIEIMNIDFPPPSNGIYNNYCEHEDLERMQKGIYTEGFFNLADDNLYKADVIKDIDGNIGQLLKTDAKFYAIHVSPSEKELQRMGNTEQEQAEAMRRYIREVFIPEYAKNFNKGLSAMDIKFYGKIHFDRDRSDNRLNIHCHLIVSHKDQSNKVKISPLTNHRNTKKGAIKGGFDRVALFENAEKVFDKLFGYNRQLSETFEYCNTMKNGTVTAKLKMQEKEINKTIQQQISTSVNQSTNHSVSQSDYSDGLSSLFSILPSGTDIGSDEQQPKHKKKKKKRRPRLS